MKYWDLEVYLTFATQKNSLAFNFVLFFPRKHVRYFQMYLDKSYKYN